MLLFGQTFSKKKNAICVDVGRGDSRVAGWDAVAYAIGGGAFLLSFSSTKAARFL